MQQYRTQRPVTDPAAFLVRTAINIRIDNYRHDRRIYGEVPAAIPDSEDPTAPADEIIAAKELLSRVISGINGLPDRTREIFLMHRVDGLKYDKIAPKLGITESAVEKHMAKAMIFLADRAKRW
jgi:RNA polymerase sigma-70 factor (ECF subfamily)